MTNFRHKWSRCITAGPPHRNGGRPGHAPELIAKEVAFDNGQIRKGGNTLTIEAIAPAPGFTECFFGLDKLVLHLQ